MASFLTFQSGIPVLVSVVGIGAPYESIVTLSADISAAYALPSGQTYNLGNHELSVFVDGIKQGVGVDYSETSTSSITFLKTVRAGQTVTVRR